MGTPLDKNHDHTIPLSQAAEHTRRHRNGNAHGKGDSGAFNAAAVLALLSQPGCVGLRYYKGRGKSGEESLILVGVDEQGNDMIEGQILDFSYPCPPYCPDTNVLNG